MIRTRTGNQLVKITDVNSPFVPDFTKGGGLITAVAVDADTSEVLMVASMNADAYAETLRTGRVTYWSRSRGTLWRKGETSGNVQHLIELRADCDGDALVVRVRQDGPACHEGFRSCFHNVVDADGSVTVVGERLRRPEDMYPGAQG